MQKYTLQPGNELRGFMIRLYPDALTESQLLSLIADLRAAWNWLAENVGADPKNAVMRARSAYAVREGLVGPCPTLPVHTGLEPSESKAKKDEYRTACRAWYQAVDVATKDKAGCRPRRLKEWLEHFGLRHDYQLLDKVVAWRHENDKSPPTISPGAHALQAVVKNFFTKVPGQRCKKFRRANEPMPLQVRSRACFTLGDFGERRGTPFYNCQVSINGLKMRGRLPGGEPGGRVLEGVSITKLADGWWASVKVEVPIRTAGTPSPGTVIGLDVGLDNLVAMSNGVRVPNARGHQYAERIAGRQSQKLPVGRLHLAASRHTRHVIYNDVVKPLNEFETIKVEQLPSSIGQMGSAKVSAMRTVVRILKGRYGERVREVAPHYTSQDCSQCGFRSKESWSYAHGRYGQCPQCGYKEDRDINAARNIASKPVLLLEV